MLGGSMSGLTSGLVRGLVSLHPPAPTTPQGPAPPRGAWGEQSDRAVLALLHSLGRQAAAALGASSPRRLPAQKPSSFSLPPAQACSALGEHSGYTQQLKQNPGALASITSHGKSPEQAAGFLRKKKLKGRKQRGNGTSDKAVAGSVEPGPHLGPSTRPGGSSGKEVNARRARAARRARTLARRERGTLGLESGGVTAAPPAKVQRGAASAF